MEDFSRFFLENSKANSCSIYKIRKFCHSKSLMDFLKLVMGVMITICESIGLVKDCWQEFSSEMGGGLFIVIPQETWWLAPNIITKNNAIEKGIGGKMTQKALFAEWLTGANGSCARKNS